MYTPLFLIETTETETHQPISIVTFHSSSTRPSSAHISSLATPPAYSPTLASFSPSIGESKGTNKRVKKQYI